MKEVERLEMLITDLLESSRPGPIKRKEVDLSKLVNDVLAGQANKLTEAGVRISKECRPGVIANVDEKRFHQVILNLILNAKDAMPEGGTLSLKTVERGEWFHIEVRDTGMGISEQDAANIFAPFFTTKASGTGLGLSICDQIVKSHGGSISFTSDENGTTFIVKIPKIIKMED
jgi:signal transduction histidine kinase